MVEVAPFEKLMPGRERIEPGVEEEMPRREFVMSVVK